MDNTCHNRGKRIGVSYTGLMESTGSGPFDARGNPAPKRHGKTYLLVSEDVHHGKKSRPGNPSGGLLCQDCHTSMDVHGDGNIHGTTLGQVEIECTDCHGTPTQYPWELPLGHGEEFGQKNASAQPRSQWGTPAAGIAMATVSKHMDRMECYACHAAWASTMDFPQPSFPLTGPRS